MIRLLIADDEALERETLADIVARRFEHEVTIETAENGRKAADTAVLWGADLILMDIEMPGMNGLDAARAVLEQRPECKVIFVTAYSLFQYAHEAMHLGACDYLLKPVNPDEVEASIRKAIRQIEAGRRLAELAPVEPEPEADPESDAAEAGENDRNALVMAHVRKYMEDNYMFDLSLDSVSEILHISPAYLSAQFKKYQKMNFLDCLTELRINAAKELLTDPFRSAAEVASMVGYEDSSYFARTFKKRTGMTPTQYRREAAKASTAGKRPRLHGRPACDPPPDADRPVWRSRAGTAGGGLRPSAGAGATGGGTDPALCGEPAGGLSYYAGSAGLCGSCGPAHRWPRESAGVQRGRTGRGAERDPADAVRRH